MTAPAPSLLYLSDADIAGLGVGPEAARAALEQALRLPPGEAVTAPKLNLPLRPGDFFQAMPAASSALGLAAVKWTGVVANPAPGQPNVNALIALSDMASGQPVAVLAGNRVTALRTAAMTAIAARRLARPDSGTLAFVGTGVQARSHLAALKPLFTGLTKAFLFGRSPSSVASFAEAVRAAGLEAVISANAREAVEAADIAVTSVPAAEGLRPFLDGAWIKPGAFASMVDLGRSWRPQSIRDLDIMATDDREQSATIAADGKLAHKGPWAADLADLASGRHQGRAGPRQRTGFIFAGMALADLAVAAHVYRRALAAGSGARLEA